MNGITKEDIIFLKEKDRGFKNSIRFGRYIEEKYNYNDSIKELYTRIVNYQVDKYGTNLHSGMTGRFKKSNKIL